MATVAAPNHTKPTTIRRPVTYTNAAEAPITLPDYYGETPQEEIRPSRKLDLEPLKGKVKQENLTVKALASKEDLTPSSATQKVALVGTKNSLDINNLTVASAIDFAAKD